MIDGTTGDPPLPTASNNNTAPSCRIAAVIEDVAWLIASGEHHPETIARRVGYRHAASLYAMLRRHKRGDLIAQFWRKDTREW